MSKDLIYYSEKSSRLRVDRSRGIAPHKPILLLSVIELVEQGFLKRNQIFLSPELIATFLKYWSYLGSDAHKSDICMPFFYMRNEGFWHLVARSGLESILSGFKPKNLAALRELIQYAYLDDELFYLLQAPLSRSYLINQIATTWFLDKTDQIAQLFQIDSFQDVQDRLREQGGQVYAPEDENLTNEDRAIVRDAAFRKVVISVYDNRCAFCKLQIFNLDQRIVDGAHIKPFSAFRDDRIENGLSLCKNHHWAFDRGWFGVNDDYTLLISDNLREESPNSRPMREFQGERIFLPVQAQYLPRADALRWHRENVFDHGDRLVLY